MKLTVSSSGEFLSHFNIKGMTYRGTYHLPYDCQVTYTLTLTVLVLFQFRGMGEVFREWYGKVSQLRSLAHTNTPVLALTATSTLNVRTKIMQHLGMGSCTMIQGSLDRPNIRYSAVKVRRDLQVTFGWLLQEIETKRTSLPRTIIFCRSIKTCASLFKLFLSHLREKSYEPVGSDLSVANRLFAMYHARIDDSDKGEILSSLKDPNGKCRLLFCTVAFGMGVNIPDIRYIIHYGPPPLTLTIIFRSVAGLVVMAVRVLPYFTCLEDVQ